MKIKIAAGKFLISLFGVTACQAQGSSTTPSAEQQLATFKSLGFVVSEDITLEDIDDLGIEEPHSSRNPTV